MNKHKEPGKIALRFAIEKEGWRMFAIAEVVKYTDMFTMEVISNLPFAAICEITKDTYNYYAYSFDIVVTAPIMRSNLKWAEEAIDKMRYIHKKMERINQALGVAKTFGEYIERFSSIVGAKIGLITISGDFKAYTIDEFCKQVDWLVGQVDEPRYSSGLENEFGLPRLKIFQYIGK